LKYGELWTFLSQKKKKNKTFACVEIIFFKPKKCEMFLGHPTIFLNLGFKVDIKSRFEGNKIGCKYLWTLHNQAAFKKTNERKSTFQALLYIYIYILQI
jgi:hypothetical protein